MKKLLYIMMLAVVFACDSEQANDCFQTTGTTVQKTVTVAGFDKILVNKNIQLILKQGPDTEVVVETGKNLMGDIAVSVVNSKLVLLDNNACNFVRDYAPTKVYVTAPNISEIRTSTQFEIVSEGVLGYDSLKLYSEDFNESETFTVGDFRMQLNCNQVSIVSNNISSFYLSGAVNELTVAFYAGTGRFEGAGLMAQKVTINHRGSNDIKVNPQQELKGVLRGIGDLIAVNHPPIVTIEQLYTGTLIFQ
ncbi:hypothetical protein IA57_02560 [Mangrovimonas yunxiaonensis]|uniref:Putative auto-transporter adhesin head GIN domain-containing protein n=1 Tax=Mangrovimonas yunxiaonensis TaxID=1197477 RepID=A0A084TM40_9FLAO|nr:head GIN domain-containing protein [Mangrovimonas yunxiaonensis]KFB01776.1 hypothetical protein IA57_02560 [Mangrovimonas yunxiaonensis]GGH40909.1 hypothetical protein GCM10011364_11380 [Mangrovimonas yunxiaonensis]